MERTIAELAQAFCCGRETACSLTETYLARIDALNTRGPELRAVIEVNPKALETAAALDAERRGRGPRGPLHGIPVLIKDNIAAHGMTTTAGSLALEGSRPRREAFIVSRLRAAGAILLGKANLSEWANFRSYRAKSGWSSRGGQCRNPYALDRSPSGSSSGSAVGVAADLCAAAVGTETDGSIVSPASVCGIVGIKPTVGLLSRAGIIPVSHTQDTAGPMARTVADAALLLAVMAGPGTLSGLASCLDPRGLEGARIGFYLPPSRTAPGPVFAEALAAIRSAGAFLEGPVRLPGEESAWESERQVLLHELKANLDRYLAELGPEAPVHSLRELIEFNESHRERVMPLFGQETFLDAEAKGPLTERAYQEALASCRRCYREGLETVFARQGFDALVAPTGGSSSLAAVSGFPSLTVPAGFLSGLPVGISWIGPAWSEPVLLKLAHAFETATRARKPPRFLS